MAEAHSGSRRLNFRALWEACRQLAASTGGTATFTQRVVDSLEDLDTTLGPLDGIVVAAGAAMGTIRETSAPPGRMLTCLTGLKPGLGLGSGQWLRQPHTPRGAALLAPCRRYDAHEDAAKS